MSIEISKALVKEAINIISRDVLDVSRNLVTGDYTITVFNTSRSVIANQAFMYTICKDEIPIPEDRPRNGIGCYLLDRNTGELFAKALMRKKMIPKYHPMYHECRLLAFPVWYRFKNLLSFHRKTVKVK